MQSSFDARTSSSDTSTKNGLRSCKSELENSKESSRDNLNKNKDIKHQITLVTERIGDNEMNYSTLSEKDLIEIERQWGELKDLQFDQSNDDEEYYDISDHEEEYIEPLRPIQEVLNPVLVRKILMKSAAASHYFAMKNFRTASGQNIKENYHYTKSYMKREVESKPSRTPKTDQRKSSTALKINDNDALASPSFRQEQNNTLYPRKQKTMIQSMIKKIEKELESDIGNGYGDAEWCQAYTKKRSESSEQKQLNDDDSNNRLTSKVLHTSKALIQTPSWRVIEDFDLPGTSSDNAYCDKNIDEESVYSDSSDLSDSSLSSSCTWVSSDAVKEYIFPKADDIVFGSKTEVRLINLTKIQIAALCKKLKAGTSTSVVAIQ